MMDQFLAAHYGNVAPTEVDDQEKIAQANMEMFVKAAAANGVNLDELPEEAIVELWNGTFSKVASEENAGETTETETPEPTKESEGEPAEDKKEKAKEEHEEKKEAAAKFAEAEFLGKVMAHSMVSELRKISSANDETAEGVEKAAAMPESLKNALGKGKDVAKSVGNAAKRGGELMTGSKVKKLVDSERSAAPGVKHLHMDAAMNEGRKVTKARIGAGAGAAAGAAAGVAAATKSKEKKGSAFEELAMMEAVKIAAADGWDADECADRVAALATLGLVDESTKVASIEDTDVAVQVRGLEYLEAAGYPVVWES